MAFFLKARVIDRRVQPDAGHDILQHAPRRAMIEHVIGGDESGRAPVAAALAIFCKPRGFIGQEAAGEGAIGAVTEDAVQLLQLICERRS